MRKAAMLICFMAALLVFCMPQADAYETYSTDRNTTNCAACHGNFRSGTYASQVDGSSWGTNLHDGHRGASMLSSDCNVCHQGSSRFPVSLSASNGTAPFNASCNACHGRPADGGAGLRQHHHRSGITECSGCHGDSNPAAFTPVGENVQPAGYFTPDPAHPTKPTDACNTGGAESRFGSARGLDNDGDLLYDASDPDCAPTPPPVPSVSLNPSSLNFGTVTTGSSVALSSQIQNTGTAILNVTGITRSAGTSTEFTWSPAAPFTVSAGGAMTLTVTYAPTALGTDSGSLSVASNDPATPVSTLSLQASAATPAMPVIGLSPASLSFGTVTVGSSATLTSQIQNNGTASLSVTNIANCTGTSAEYSGIFPALPFTVAPGSNVAMSVAYAPTNGGSDAGCIKVSSNDPSTPAINLNLSGSGLVPPPAVSVISISPASLSFGNVTVGSSSSLSGQIRNNGTAGLNVTNITACTGTSAEFTGAFPAVPFSVAPAGSAAFSVDYTPVDGSTDAGCIRIASNDPASPVTDLNLSGTGIVPPPSVPVINLNPAALSFGDVTIGSTVTKSSQVQNVGSAGLTITDVSLCSGTTSEFIVVSPAVPFTVVPGSSTALMVTYDPADAGTDAGCIVVLSNDPASPSSALDLQGTGLAASPPPAPQPQPQPQPAGSDIDIKKFKTEKKVKLPGSHPISPRLDVINMGQAAADALATLIGVQNGAEVYNQSSSISVQGKKTARVFFPSYTPSAEGTISWNVTVEDGNPDSDVASAITVVKKKHQNSKDDNNDDNDEEEEDDDD